VTTTIAVVVATHERPRRLAQLLTALRGQSRAPEEVVVVDDGSDPETGAVIAAERERGELPLRTIRRETAGGPAIAREQGWRATTAAIVAFTDDDCAPEPGWLAAIERAAEDDPGCFVQGRTLPNPTELPQQGPFSRTICVRQLDPMFQTCNIAYRRELLARIGGFDTETFGRAPGGEDCDLGWRAIGAGAHAVFAPDAVVHHAVEDLGPLGKLRVAARWTTPMAAYVRHPRLRDQLALGLFWRRTHLLFTRAVLGLALPDRWPPLKSWLVYPYAHDIWARSRTHGGGPLLSLYFAVHDVIEMWAVARAAIRYRRPML